MLKKVLMDLKVHIVLTFISILIICKFSEAPPVFDIIADLFQRPLENTYFYEILRVTENFCMAYIASLIFYILVDYIPVKQEEERTEKLLSKSLEKLYLHMNKVISYFRFATRVSNFSKVTEEQIKSIDDFTFSTTSEFLMVGSTRNNKADGEHVEKFNAKKEMILAGEGIIEILREIDAILAKNKMENQFIVTMNELRNSGFLVKLCEIMPNSSSVIKGVSCECGYLNFYRDIAEFEKLEQKLEKYDFVKLGTVFRTATNQEIAEWNDYQKRIREENPELDAIDFKQRS